MIRSINNQDIIQELGIIMSGAEIDRSSIADMLRTALEHWGVSLARDVKNYARRQLIICGVADPTPVINKVLDELISLGECCEMMIDGSVYLAPTAPRWIKLNHHFALYLGVHSLPQHMYAPHDPHEIVRRIDLTQKDHLLHLDVVGACEVSIEDWLYPRPFQLTAEKMGINHSKKLTLSNLWSALEKHIDVHGTPSGDANISLLSGHPGGFFGKAQALNGRWSPTAQQGLWCAYREGYQEGHQHPCLVLIEEERRLILDLYDHDFWKWALISKGLYTHQFEQTLIQQQGEKFEQHVTFPLPKKLKTYMSFWGSYLEGWRWRCLPDSPLLMDVIKEL